MSIKRRANNCFSGYLLYICICGLFVFVSSLLFLSFQSPNIITKESFRFPKSIVIDIQHQPDKYEIKSKLKHHGLLDTSITHLLVPEFLYVAKVDELPVYSYDTNASTITGILPLGSLFIGFEVLEVIFGRYDGLICDNIVHVMYPLQGWICLENGPTFPISLISLTTPPQTVLLQPNNESDACKGPYLLNNDLSGHDIVDEPIALSSPSYCCKECLATKACNSWAFTKDGNCWLKRFLDVNHVINNPKPDVISGIIENPPINNIEGAIDTNKPHFDIHANVALMNAKINKLASDTITTKKLSSCCSFDSDAISNHTSLHRMKLGLDFDQPSTSSPWELQLHRKTISWNEQWPIGNGRIGALIGGLADREVIPLSISGLYLSEIKSSPNSKTVEESKYVAFMEARKLLLEGKVQESQMRMRGMIDRRAVLGMFQYAADLSFLYTTGYYRYHNTTTPPPNMPRMKGMKPNSRLNSQRIKVGRNGVINDILDRVECMNCMSMASQFVRGSLNMRDGVTTTYIVEASGNDGEHINLSKREWFASEVDDIIVGQISSSFGSSSSRGEYGGLSVAMKLSRDHNKNMPPPAMNINVHRMISDPSTSSSEDDDYAEFYLELKPTSTVTIPHTIVCGIVRCSKSSSDSGSMEIHGEVIICNNISTMNTYTSIIIKSDNLISSTQDLHDECMMKVSSASSIGYDALYVRHVEHFSSHMKAVDLHIDSMNTSNTCIRSAVGDRLKSFGVGCSEVEVNDVDGTISSNTLIEGIDLTLLMQSYQYGRYLLLSASTRSVSNLQGIWADGPTSAWNGDYHMNINFQEIYWASGVANLHDTINPVIDFIVMISDKDHGHRIAKEYYGCVDDDSWVAHGFTDDCLNAGILGDTQWSLCVTCGAWLANQMFDLILFSHEYHDTSSLMKLLDDKVLAIFRGVAQFFIHYMVVVDGTSYTGPTTSPENSYRVKQRLNATIEMSAQEKASYMEYTSHIGMSPAIDASILRQASNIYTLLVQWLTAANGDANYVKDIALAMRFQDLLLTMTGSALPVVTSQNMILEYPRPFPDAITGIDIDKVIVVDDNMKIVDETMDIGHRHYSSMHWLYPNTFLPSNRMLQQSLYDAAKHTLDNKRQHAGGHTSWSAGWEACLYARLGDGESSYDSIERILTRYAASNLLSLHPSLQKKDIVNVDCMTCFEEMLFPMAGPDAVAAPNRGMTTITDAKFQLDGNLAITAAISEMLLQSHMMGMIHLLPALPANILVSGSIIGLRARGGASIAISWQRGKLSAAIIDIPSCHPWWGSYSKTHPGFYAYDNKQSYGHHRIIKVLSPNEMILSQLSHIDAMLSCSKWENIDTNDDHDFASMTHASSKKVQVGILTVTSYPCKVHLCNSHLSSQDCNQAISTLNRSRS